MNIIIARIRYRLINKPRHRQKHRKQAPVRVPYVGPEQWQSMKRSRVMT